MADSIVISSYARTPIGAFQGDLAGVSAVALAASAVSVAASPAGIPGGKLNVNGVATALGHPIGASGARVIATLLGALQERGLRRGVASLGIGGGEAIAIALELI